MTADMLRKARRNIDEYRNQSGLNNVEFRLGEIEHLPVADASVDVVISNCVINLSPDKPQVWKESKTLPGWSVGNQSNSHVTPVNGSAVGPRSAVCPRQSAWIRFDPFMHSIRFQQRIALVCLWAIVLNTAFLARGLVRCTDVEGVARIEWGCEKNDRGHCQSACESAESDTSKGNPSKSEPCDDSPAISLVIASDRVFTAKAFVMPPLMLAAMLPVMPTVVEATPIRPHLHGPIITASPPALVTIRTVVILV